eukprot:1771891-Amphidinium_carterae.1
MASTIFRTHIKVSTLFRTHCIHRCKFGCEGSAQKYRSFLYHTMVSCDFGTPWDEHDNFDSWVATHAVARLSSRKDRTTLNVRKVLPAFSTNPMAMAMPV